MNRLKISLLAVLIIPVLSDAAATGEVKAPPPVPGYTRNLLSPSIDGLKEKVLYYASKNPGKKPLLIFLHGAGGHKADIRTVQSLFAKGFSRNNLVCNVVRPQSEKGWPAGSIDQLLDYMIANHDIDERRIYVAGYSMGGAGT
ncbi:hypothetical protein [Pontiella sulfatireligans]|uniref:Uncharacterized protein n=1 Tax=Pontiella sulfatireligans TaxID=2750658 RepID=A0A6C2UNL2_9BACT|nr:hypothetical protein [Pontiella sulfatireligans]VGO21870.1 hypothetical protein SCARR_03950 [Pontiella sulfatireligans]